MLPSSMAIQHHHHHLYRSQEQQDHLLHQQHMVHPGGGLIEPPYNMAEYQRMQLRIHLMEQEQLKRRQQQQHQHQQQEQVVVAGNVARKRPREFMDSQQMVKVSEYPNVSTIPNVQPTTTTTATTGGQQFVGVSTGLQLGLGNANSGLVGGGGDNISFLTGEAWLQQQSNELDQFLRLQQEKYRQILVEKAQQGSRVLIATVERYLMRCLKEREMKVGEMNRRNKELEEKLRQLSMETRRWQKQARDYEGMATSLSNSLQVVTLTREQSGDSEEDTSASSRNEEDARARVLLENRLLKEQRTCRVCRTNEVCILLLPCQHLCLCKECEIGCQACPICSTSKDAYFHVFMA